MSIERPSRRTLIKASAWTAPIIVAATAVPAHANGSGAGASSFSIQVTRTGPGLAELLVTNLTAAPLSVSLSFPYSLPESTLNALLADEEDWLATSPSDIFLVTTIPAAGTASTVTVGWTQDQAPGTYIFGANAGTESTSTSLLYAAPAARAARRASSGQRVIWTRPE